MYFPDTAINMGHALQAVSKDHISSDGRATECVCVCVCVCVSLCNPTLPDNYNLCTPAAAPAYIFIYLMAFQV